MIHPPIRYVRATPPEATGDRPLLPSRADVVVRDGLDELWDLLDALEDLEGGCAAHEERPSRSPDARRALGLRLDRVREAYRRLTR